MPEYVAGNALRNMKVSVSTGNQQPGANILISLSSRTTDNGILISSWPAAATPPASPACEYIFTGMKTASPIGDLTLISTNMRFPYSVTVDLEGIQYTILEGIPTDIPGGKLSVSSISLLGAKVCLELADLPPVVPPGPPPVVPPVNGLPPSPVLAVCVLPELTLNFIEVVRQAVRYISCNIANLILQVDWMISVLAALIPQLLAGISYFLSLRWMDDLIKRLITALDLWIDGVIERILDAILPPAEFWENYKLKR